MYQKHLLQCQLTQKMIFTLLSSHFWLTHARVQQFWNSSQWICDRNSQILKRTVLSSHCIKEIILQWSWFNWISFSHSQTLSCSSKRRLWLFQIHICWALWKAVPVKDVLVQSKHQSHVVLWSSSIWVCHLSKQCNIHSKDHIECCLYRLETSQMHLQDQMTWLCTHNAHILCERQFFIDQISWSEFNDRHHKNQVWCK